MLCYAILYYTMTAAVLRGAGARSGDKPLDDREAGHFDSRQVNICTYMSLQNLSLCLSLSLPLPLSLSIYLSISLSLYIYIHI